MSDHYEVLEISRDASTEEIHRAYRSLALRYHPDRNPAPDASAKMAAVNEAYEVLRDRTRRREYDAVHSPVVLSTELATTILLAARDMILRAGWAVVEDGGETLVLTSGKQRVRVFLVERLNREIFRKLLLRYPPIQPFAILAVSIDGAIHLQPEAVVVGLMRGERYGALLSDPNGPFKPLLAAFL